MKQWTRKGAARGLLVAAALLFVVAEAQPAAAPRRKRRQPVNLASAARSSLAS